MRRFLMRHFDAFLGAATAGVGAFILALPDFMAGRDHVHSHLIGACCVALGVIIAGIYVARLRRESARRQP